MKRTEPNAVREIHEIRERLHNEQKDWTRAQLLEHYQRVGEQFANELGLTMVPPKRQRTVRKIG